MINFYDQVTKQCTNCGGIGHIHKNCNHPVSSYGVIPFRIVYDAKTGIPHPEYLMVQRKDSLNYVEFIRGKYMIENKQYILKMFSNMTERERCGIVLCSNFDDLWKDLWQISDCQAFYKEYSEAKKKFETIKNGYYVRNNDGEMTFFDFKYILTHTTSTINESETGFSKGRRSINESDLACAIREFREETGIHPKNLKLLRDLKPFDEVFIGSNKVRYRHVYYLAYCHHYVDLSKFQTREIRSVKWLKYEDALNKIRKFNVERRELLIRVHCIILRKLQQQNTIIY